MPMKTVTELLMTTALYRIYTNNPVACFYFYVKMMKRERERDEKNSRCRILGARLLKFSSEIEAISNRLSVI